MSNYRRAHIAGATYFFTVVAYRRQRILCDDAIRRSLRSAIARTRADRPFHIDAWVQLPDHLHCIWTLPRGDTEFSTRWSMIKRRVSRACRDSHRVKGLLSESARARRESTLWQRRYWEHRIRDEADLIRHLEYIHYNPVKHGLVRRAADWPYSTLHRDIARGIYPEDWGRTAALQSPRSAKE
ncbi:REP-associated tyrosine transposase [Lysobacter sp. D1-1-M9]|uniref:REP-associated tyrosine transposase n=1 Tax=Novilysobacter longmucuonensis TaxID=3098603 RepID=UPI002FC7D4F0